MNYYYTKDVVVSGTQGSFSLNVSTLMPLMITFYNQGLIFAPRS